jgi:hypothetical protein
MVVMSDGTAILPDFVKTFPFESQLSLALLIRFWEEQATEHSPRGELARDLVARLRAVPELARPIDDITLLDQHGGLVDALMSAVFPSVFWDQAYMGALIPFTLRSVYGTRVFDSIIGPDGVLYGRLNLDMKALKDFRLLNAYALALERLYGIQFPIDYPLILTTQEAETGLDRHFKVQFEGRFVDVEPLRPLPPLSDEMRKRLVAQAVDLDGLAAVIPPGSVRFSGFTVVKAADVTDQEVLSSIKRDLIDKESIVSNARFEKLQAKLRTLFRRPTPVTSSSRPTAASSRAPPTAGWGTLPVRSTSEPACAASRSSSRTSPRWRRARSRKRRSCARACAAWWSRRCSTSSSSSAC